TAVAVGGVAGLLVDPGEGGSDQEIEVGRAGLGREGRGGGGDPVFVPERLVAGDPGIGPEPVHGLAEGGEDAGITGLVEPHDERFRREADHEGLDVVLALGGGRIADARAAERLGAEPLIHVGEVLFGDLRRGGAGRRAQPLGIEVGHESVGLFAAEPGALGFGRVVIGIGGVGGVQGLREHGGFGVAIRGAFKVHAFAVGEVPVAGHAAKAAGPAGGGHDVTVAIDAAGALGTGVPRRVVGVVGDLTEDA